MAQALTGEVRDGVIVLDQGTPVLPEGTRVRVVTVEEQDDLNALRDLLLSVAGKAQGLPSDLAEQHDHYLHGTPKR